LSVVFKILLLRPGFHLAITIGRMKQKTKNERYRNKCRRGNRSEVNNKGHLGEI
jgi:hypothetical protein